MAERGGGAKVGEGMGFCVVRVMHTHVRLCRTKIDAVNGGIHAGENPTRFARFRDNTSGYYRGAPSVCCTAPKVTSGDIGNFPLAITADYSPVVSNHPLVSGPKATSTVPNGPIPLMDHFVEAHLLVLYQDLSVLFVEVYLTQV